MSARLDRIEKGLELLMEGILELKESQKKTDEQQKKTDEQLKKTDEQLLESKKFVDAEMIDLKESLKKTTQKIDEVGRQLGDLGLVQGEVAEDLFYRNVKVLFRKRDLLFKDVQRNLKKKGVGEYDIVAENGESVLVIEVKNKLQKRMVDRFVRDKLPKFSRIFPKYRDRRILGGIGALVVKDDIGRYAEKAGLFVLTQSDDGGATLLNRENFKAKPFS